MKKTLSRLLESPSCYKQVNQLGCPMIYIYVSNMSMRSIREECTNVNEGWEKEEDMELGILVDEEATARGPSGGSIGDMWLRIELDSGYWLKCTAATNGYLTSEMGGSEARSN
jgi:hypothetical protein